MGWDGTLQSRGDERVEEESSGSNNTMTKNEAGEKTGKKRAAVERKADVEKTSKKKVKT